MKKKTTPTKATRAKTGGRKNWPAADTPIICDSCEGFYPTSARSQGYWFVPGNSEHRIAVWICLRCAQAVTRARAIDDICDCEKKARGRKAQKRRPATKGEAK